MIPALSNFRSERFFEQQQRLKLLGHAHGTLCKSADTPQLAYSLAGRLILSASGWGLLEVPNALVRGAFDALHEPGVELPPGPGGRFNAHISVLRPEDLEQLGGAKKVTEWGHFFRYTLGPIRSVVPDGWSDMGRCWFIVIKSPDLEKLRKSYGLAATPKDGQHPFHVTIGVRRKKVLQGNEVSKAAACKENWHIFLTTPPWVKAAAADETFEAACATWQGLREKIAGHSARHIVITGHSGVGKTTTAKLLADQLGLPIHKLDDDKVWKEGKDVADHPERYTPGTKAFRQYRHLRKKLVRRALAHKHPHIIEGAQALVDPHLLRGHRVVVVDADRDTIVRQRLERDGQKGKLAPDGANRELRVQKANYLYQELDPLVQKLKKEPGVETVHPKDAAEWVKGQKEDDHQDRKDRPPIIGVDLDGTLVKNRPGEPYDPNKFGDPRPEIIDVIRRLRQAGCFIIVYTVRGGTEENCDVVAELLEAHDIPYDTINENPWQPPNSSDKMFADIYLDDRAVSATLDEGQILQRIIELLEAKDPPPAFDMSALKPAATVPSSSVSQEKTGDAAPGVPSLHWLHLIDDILMAQKAKQNAQQGEINNTSVPAELHTQPQTAPRFFPRFHSVIGQDKVAMPALFKTAAFARVGYRHSGDRQVMVCPRCDRDLDEKSVYTDKKGWKFCRRCLRAGKGPLSLPVKLAALAVPHKQETSYSCGPGAVKSIMKAHGEDVSEARLRREMATTPKDGTFPARLIAAARAHGFEVETQEDMGIGDLMASVDAGRPVICPVQMYGDKEQQEKDETGHYVAVFGYDKVKGLLHYQDPATGKPGSMNVDEFNDRWHDQDGEGTAYVHYGIAMWKPGLDTRPERPGGVTPEMYEEYKSRTKKAEAPPPMARVPVTEISVTPSQWLALGGLPGQGVIEVPLLWLQLILASDRAQNKQAAQAEGIPDRSQYGDLSKLKPGQLLDWVVQRHHAHRAGLHHDVRLGNKETGLFSWAARKGLPGHGQKHLAVQQPLHSHGYKDFEGEIPSGYGAGHVSREQSGKVLVTHIAPGEVHFTEGQSRYPQRFVLKQMEGKNWLLLNATKTEAIPHEKVHYTKVPAEHAEKVLRDLQPGSSAQAKIDGAASLTKLYKDHAEVVSYRAAKGTGHPIVHTERVFAGRPRLPVPRALVGTVLRGELYGTDRGGHAIRPQALGGLLNSGVARSLATQQEQGVSLKQMLFDVEQLGKKRVGMDTPYVERLSMLKKVLPHLPAEHLHGPEEATTPEAALDLWKKIKGGKHPLTREGIVIHPSEGKPSKVKLTEEHDVHIRDIFPGLGKYQGKGAGGFRYSATSGGPVLGEVGTGLSDELRRQMHEDPRSFLGRVARVRAQERFPSGALRAPSLLALHEDEPLAKAGHDTATGGRSQAGPNLPPPQLAHEAAVPLDQPDEALLARCHEPFDPNEYALPLPPPQPNETSQPASGASVAYSLSY